MAHGFTLIHAEPVQYVIFTHVAIFKLKAGHACNASGFFLYAFTQIA